MSLITKVVPVWRRLRGASGSIDDRLEPVQLHGSGLFLMICEGFVSPESLLRFGGNRLVDGRRDPRRLPIGRDRLAQPCFSQHGT
ncbi:hypothetical protein [Dactylosporangium sp. NPDC005555]|uniref:hypothetical protein n=1 Tax=Dactylosporangium sp. NPDC005555 TaxID=3154889 RepID=UPI0033B8B99C